MHGLAPGSFAPAVAPRSFAGDFPARGCRTDHLRNLAHRQRVRRDRRPALATGYAVAAARCTRRRGSVVQQRGPKHLLLRLTGTTMRRVPIPGPADGELEDVAATSAANAWAVGYIGGVNPGSSLILHWNGATWTRTPLPAAAGLGGNAGDIGAVDASSATNAWAVGSRPVILHWNGRRWGQVASPDIGMPYALSDVATTSARNVWAVGSLKDSYRAAILLHWNGPNWTCALSRQENPPKYPDTYVDAVSASSADNAWAVGGYFDTAERALALHWNGHTWKQVMTPHLGPVAGLEDVALIPSSGRVWAVDDADTAVLILRWIGIAWR